MDSAETGSQTGGTPPSTSTGGAPEGSNSPAQTGQEGSTSTETGAAGQGNGQHQPERKHPMQRRVDTLTRQKYQLEAELKLLREQQSKPAAGNGQGQQGSGGAPDISKFTDFNDYIDAVVAYRVEQGLTKNTAASETKLRERMIEQHQQEIAESWRESVTSYAESVPDFYEVVEAADVSVSQPLMQAVMEADDGPAVLYYLAQNPKEVRKLNTMSGSAVTRHIGRLEERLAATKAQSTQSKASKAPTTVSGSGNVTSAKTPADNMPIAEWMKAERKRLAEKEGRFKR